MTGQNNATSCKTNHVVLVSFVLGLLVFMLSRSALAWGGPCIDVVDEDRVIDGNHYTAVVVGDDTPGCDLYRVVKRFPQKDENGNELSVHEQILSIYAVNGERIVDGKSRPRTVLRTCMQADPWPDTTAEESAFCKHGYVNYPPNGFGGEILVPRTRELTQVERAIVVSKKACKKLDADGLTSAQDAELVANCKKLDSTLAFIGKAEQPPRGGSDGVSQRIDSKEVEVLKKENVELKQKLASMQPLANWGRYLPYAMGLIVLFFSLTVMLTISYLKRGEEVVEVEVEKSGKNAGTRESFLSQALEEAELVKKAQEQVAHARAEREKAAKLLHESQGECDVLQAKLEKAEADKKELSESLASNVKAGNALVKANGKLQQDLDAVSEQRENFSLDLARVTSEKVRAEARVAELAKAELELKLQVENSEKELQAANEQLLAAEKRIAILETDIGRYKVGSLRPSVPAISTVTEETPLPELGMEDAISTVTEDGAPIPRRTVPIGVERNFHPSGQYSMIAGISGETLDALNPENSRHNFDVSALGYEEGERSSQTIRPSALDGSVSHFPLELDPDQTSDLHAGMNLLFERMKSARLAEVDHWKRLVSEGGTASFVLEPHLHRAEQAYAKLTVLGGLDSEDRSNALVSMLTEELASEYATGVSEDVLRDMSVLAGLNPATAKEMRSHELCGYLSERLVSLTGYESDSSRRNIPMTHELVRAKLMQSPIQQVVVTAMACMMALSTRSVQGEVPEIMLASTAEVQQVRDFLSLPVKLSNGMGRLLADDDPHSIMRLYQLGATEDSQLSESGHRPTLPSTATFDPKATLMGIAPAVVVDDDGEGSGPRLRSKASETRTLGSVDDGEGSDSGKRSVS
ncbi:hypothetical protein KKG46_03050 [Patescibacteria group bacterium]|nr:hypothetical protein [Patescibacteria group bacterium]